MIANTTSTVTMLTHYHPRYPYTYSYVLPIVYVDHTLRQNNDVSGTALIHRHIRQDTWSMRSKASMHLDMSVVSRGI